MGRDAVAGLAWGEHPRVNQALVDGCLAITACRLLRADHTRVDHTSETAAGMSGPPVE